MSETATTAFAPDILSELDAARAARAAWHKEQGIPDPADAAHGPDGNRKLVVTRASSITPRRVEWLWDGRMPLGALALLAGREGLGKSTLTAWIVSRVTRGLLPGELQGKPRPVIIAATEDSWEHTLVPRLIAADADLDLVLRVDVETSTGFTTGLNLPGDLPDLADLVRSEQVAMLVLDPLMSRLEQLDTHKDAEVRQALEPLVRIADETGMGILGLIHLNKSSTDPLNAVMGSKAFTAVARSVSTVVEDKDDEDDRRRLFGTVKNNLGPALPSSQVYTVETATVHGDGAELIPTGRLQWHGEVDTTIKAAMADAGVEVRGALGEATEWLEDYLSLHPGTPRKKVLQDAARDGHAEATVKRAASRVGVLSVTEGFPRVATWSIAAQSDQTRDVSAGGPPGESVINETTDPTESDQGKRRPPVGPVGSVGSTGSRVEANDPTDDPTGEATPCEDCGDPLDSAALTVHPGCEGGAR